MQNNSELFKGQPKYQGHINTFEKKINSQIQPKNFPKGQTIELIIDVISDKVCLFVKKDNKNYENLDTNFTEKDIVRLVNSSLELHPRNSNILLKYDDQTQIELKNVQEFTSVKLRSPAKQDTQEDIEQMGLEEMYEKLGNQWPKDILYMKEVNEHYLEQTSNSVQQLQERLGEIEQMKQEQQDPIIISILEIKVKVFRQEFIKLQELQQFINQLENYEPWTQIFYLKVLQFFQQIKRKYSAYQTQKECLEKQLVMRTDDLRRYKLRKQAKDLEDCEKKIQAMGTDFEALANQQFFIDPFELINYQFLSCDETEIYKKEINCLEKQLQSTEHLITLATEKIEQEQESLERYESSISEVSFARSQQQNTNSQLQIQLKQLDSRSKEILIWRDKYNQLSKVIDEMQSKHAVKVQQLNQHLQIKGNEIPQLKAQLENLNIQLEENKKNEQKVEVDPKSKSLQDELQRIKLRNSQLEIKITKLQSEIQKKREDFTSLKNESQNAQEQLNELKLHESQVMQQLAKQEVTKKELAKAQQKNLKKADKKITLQSEIQEKLNQVQAIQENAKFIQNNIYKLKSELEKQKGVSNKKDSEIKNLKLRLDLNVK